MTNNISLLTEEERTQLPLVILRRNKFKTIIKSSVVNYNTLFSNCLMIQGKAGTGKTTLCETFLDQLKEDGIIAGTKRVPGHVTPRSMYHVMKETASPVDGKPYVLLLDDVDCLGDEGCLELMKAAFDTKSNTKTNRKVFYMTEDGGTGFTFNGFGIIICNNDFGSSKKLSVHQEALLDRVNQMSIDLQPKDMMIFTTHLLEKYLNDNEDGLTETEIESVKEMFDTDIRKWMRYDAFRKARINYSIRLVKKFVDCQRAYGDDWREFNIAYRKLEAICEMEDAQNGLIDVDDVAVQPKVKVIKKAKATKKNENAVDGLPKKEPKKNRKGLYIKADGTPYGSTRQYQLRKKFA